MIALALGIGANTAIFSVVNAVLLKPLPFAEPGRLLMVYEKNLQRGFNRGSVSYPNFADLRDQNRYSRRCPRIIPAISYSQARGEPLRLQGAIVNADLFPLLGVTPTLGRTFYPTKTNQGQRPRRYSQQSTLANAFQLRSRRPRQLAGA